MCCAVCLSLCVLILSIRPKFGAYIGFSFYSWCDFWTSSNKYIRCCVPLQPSELRPRCPVSTEPFVSVKLGDFWLS